MSTRPQSSSRPERPRDPLAASISYARALRYLARYRDARDAVECYGGDSSALLPPPSFAEMERRYADLLREEVLQGRVETASAEVCGLELIGAIIVDRLAPHDAPLCSDGEDLSCALQLLQWLLQRANSRDIAEGLRLAKPGARAEGGGQ